MPAAKPVRPMTPAEQSLAVANLPLAWWWAGRLTHGGMCLADREDVASTCLLALCLAAQRHDPGRGAFAACLKWAVREQIKAAALAARPAGMKHTTRYPDVPSTTCVPPGNATVLLDARFYAVDDPAAD